MKRTSFLSLSIFLISIVLNACGAPPLPGQANTQPVTQEQADSSVNTSGTINIKADVWADNWFAFYLAD